MGNLYILGDKFITINIDNITFWGNQFKPQQIDYIQEAVSNSMERDNSYILQGNHLKLYRCKHLHVWERSVCDIYKGY